VLLPKRMARVFLCHNSRDKNQVKAISLALLSSSAVRTWLDSWEIPGGADWERHIRRAFADSTSCAVFLGAAGFGAYQRNEIDWAKQRQAVDPDYRIVPVVLPGAAPESVAEFEKYLPGAQWVDLRDQANPDLGVAALASALRGGRPGPPVRVVATAVAAERWDQAGRSDRSLLIRGRALREAETLAKTDRVFDDLSLEFITASSADAHRRARVAGVVLAVVAVALGSLTFYTYLAKRSETAARKQAETDRDTATSVALAAQSRIEFERAPDLALLLAARADGLRSTDVSRSSLLHALDDAPTRGFLFAGTNLAQVQALSNSSVITADWNGNITMWNLEAFQPIATVRVPTAIRRLSLSPDRRFVSVCGEDGLRILTVQSLQITAHHMAGRNVAACKWLDDQRLVVSSELTGVALLDAKSGAVTALPSAKPVSTDSIAVDQSRSLVVAAGSDFALRLWDLSEGVPDAVVVKLRALPTSIALSSDGRFAALGFDEVGLELWDRSAWTPLVRVSDGSVDGRILALAFSPDSRRLVWGGDGGRVNILDISDRVEPPPRAYHVHADAVLSVAFTPDATRLVSASRDGIAWVCDPSGLSLRATTLSTLESSEWVTAVSDADSHENRIVGRQDGRVALLDDRGMVRSWMPAHIGRVTSAVEVAGRFITVGQDHFAREFAFAGQGLEPNRTAALAHPVERLFPSGDRVAWVASDGASGWLEPDTLQLNVVATMPTSISPGEGTISAYHSRRRWLFAMVGQLELWRVQLETGAITKVKAFESFVNDLAIDESADRLYVSRDGAIECLDLLTGAPIATMRIGDRPLARLAILPQFGLLASINTYNDYTVWSLSTQQQVGPWATLTGLDALPLPGTSGPWSVLTRSYDPNRGNVYSLLRWEFDSAALRALAAKAASRLMSAEEQRRFALTSSSK
jgi:WD40 repeat protein